MIVAEDTQQADTLELATELTIAWLSNPNTKADSAEVAGVLRQMHDAVTALSNSVKPEPVPEAEEFTPAVSVRKSLASKDHIISLIDGKPYKALRRHLTGHGLTPDQYRQRYGLKSDYPMVSESYSQVRRDMAKKIGLGRKPGTKMLTASKKAAAPTKRGRKPKVQ